MVCYLFFVLFIVLVLLGSTIGKLDYFHFKHCHISEDDAFLGGSNFSIEVLGQDSATCGSLHHLRPNLSSMTTLAPTLAPMGQVPQEPPPDWPSSGPDLTKVAPFSSTRDLI